MFQLFWELKEESEFYRTFEMNDGSGYMTIHYNLEKVQRWCKGMYHVQVIGNGTDYKCECGLFEHFGLPCSHIIRVQS